MKYKMTFSQKIAFTAMFAALCIAVKLIPNPFGNASPYKVSFFYIPAMLSGIFLGPIYAAAACLAGDLLGNLIVLGYFPWPLMLVGNTLIGPIAGLIFWYNPVKALRHPAAAIILSGVAVLMCVTYGLNTLQYILPPVNMYPTYLAALGVRLPQGLAVAINTGLLIPLYYALHRAYFHRFLHAPYKSDLAKTDAV